MSDSFDYLDQLVTDNTNKPGKAINFIDPPSTPETVKGADNIVSKINADAGGALTAADIAAIKEGTKKGGTFDIAMPSAAATPSEFSYLDNLTPAKPAAPAVVLPKPPADTTFAEDMAGARDRFLGGIKHMIDSSDANSRRSSALKTLNEFKTGLSPSPTGWAPTTITSDQAAQAQKDFFTADAELAGTAAEQQRMDSQSSRSKSRQALDAEKAVAENSSAPIANWFKANLHHPAAASAAMLESVAPIITSLAITAVQPEVGIPLLAAQVGAQTNDGGIDSYLRKMGKDPTNAADRQEFFSNPQNVRDAEVSRDLHTAFNVATVLAALGVSRVARLAGGTGTAAKVATKALIADTAAQAAVQTGGIIAANKLSGEKTSVDEVASTALAGVGMGIVGGHGFYKGEIQVRAARADAVTKAALAAHAADVGQAKNVNLKEQVIAAQDTLLQQDRAQAEKSKTDALAQQDSPTDRKAAEQEAAFRTIERQRTADKLAQNPNMRVEPVKPVTPEEVQAEWQQKKDVEAARLERVALGDSHELLRQRQELATKKAEAEAQKAAELQAKTDKSQKIVETEQRNQIADQVLTDLPNATPEELATELHARLKDAPPVTVEKVAEPVAAPKTTPIKAEPAAAPEAAGVPVMITSGMRAHLRNKGYTPAEIGKLTPQAAHDILSVKGKKETAPSAPLTPEDAEVAALLSKLVPNNKTSLDMPTKAGDKQTPTEFPKTVHKIVTALGEHGGVGNDVHEAILNGRIQFHPNAESIGRKQDIGGASIDLEQGVIRVYTDHIDPKAPGGIVGEVLRAAAIHEPTHGLQTNPRSGRDSFITALTSTNPNSKIITRIRDLAASGNKVAQKAVANADMQASRASEKGQDPEFVRNHELVPNLLHLAHESLSGGKDPNSGKSIGRLGGVIRDLQSAARNILLKHTKLNITPTLRDMEYASRGILKELNATDIPKNKVGMGGRSGSLDMTVGPKAILDNTHDQPFYEQRDGTTVTEITDHKAEVLPEIDNLDRKDLKLDQAEKHDELFKAYPLARDIKVILDPTLKGGNYALFTQPTIEEVKNGGQGTIHISKETWNGPRQDLLSAIHHETQHWVQWHEGMIDGANVSQFMDPAIQKAHALALAEKVKTIKEYDLGAALKELSPADRAQYDKILESYRKSTGAKDVSELTPIERSKEFLGHGFGEKVRSPELKQQFDNYSRKTAAHKEALSKYQADHDRAMAIYVRDYGETQARNTEHRMNMTPEERRANPPESTMKDAKFKIPVEETFDSLKYKGRNAANYKGDTKVRASSDGSLDMPARERAVDESPIEKRKLPKWVYQIFSSAGGTGAKIREIMEHSKAVGSGDVMLGEGTLRRYQDGLQEEAARRGMEPDALAQEITAKLDSISKTSDSYSQNRAAYKAVADQYGAAGEALMAGRDHLDSLSKEMLRQRVAEGTPLTPTETKRYATIANSLGRYTHRQFAIHAGKTGKDFSRAILKDYAKYIKNGGKVSDKVAANYERVANGVKAIIDEQLIIPDNAELQEMSADSVRRMYSAWGRATNPDALSLEQMRTELAESRDAINDNQDRLTQKGEEIVKQILALNPPEGPIMSYYRGGKQDSGILEQRTKISPEILSLMGEITDPGLKLFASTAKVTEFLARSKMLLELRDLNEPSHIQPPEASGTSAVKGMTKLDNEAYGPLQNHFVSPHLHDQLASHIQQLATFEQAVAMAAGKPGVIRNHIILKAIDKWVSIAGTTKMVQVAWKPVGFLYNFIGGPDAMLKNGNINPKHFGTAFTTASEIIGHSINPKLSGENARRVTAAGVTDSAFTGDITREQYHELTKVINHMRGKDPSAIMEGLRKTKLFAQEGYSMMDVVWKIANFYHQADVVLPEYYKAIEKTTGDMPSQKEIDRKAADIVNDTNITYKRVAPFVKVAEKFGVTQFGSYFYDVFRHEFKNVHQAFKEIKLGQDAPNAEAARIMYAQGAKRLMGQLTSWSLKSAAAVALGSMVFGKDKKKAEKLRALLPDYLQNQDFIKMGVDKDGKDVLFDISRIDQVGPMTDIMRSVVNQKFDIDKLSQNIFDLYVAPRVGTRIIEAIGTSTGLSTKKPSTPLVKEVFPAGYEAALNAGNAITGGRLTDRGMKAWTNVAENWIPGAFAGERKSNVRPVPTDLSATVGLALTHAGGHMYRLDSDSALKTAGYDYSDTLKAQKTQVKELFQDHPNLTSDQLTRRLGQYQKQEKEQFDKLEAVYQGLLELDYTPRQISVKLKALHISAETIKQLRSGEFAMHSASVKSLKAAMDSELVGKSGQEKIDIKKKWDNAKSLLQISAHDLSEQDNGEGN